MLKLVPIIVCNIKVYHWQFIINHQILQYFSPASTSCYKYRMHGCIAHEFVCTVEWTMSCTCSRRKTRNPDGWTSKGMNSDGTCISHSISFPPFTLKVYFTCPFFELIAFTSLIGFLFSFQAMFSTTKRRQLERSLAENSSHRPILSAGAPTLDREGSEDPETQ